MENTFATLHDHMVQIYQNFNILNPETKPHAKKSIPVNDTHHIEFSVSSSISGLKSIGYQLVGNDNSGNYPLTVDQAPSQARGGKVKLGKTDYRHYIDFDEAVKVVDTFKLEDVILKESAKLQKILDYDFTQDFSKRDVFKASNETTLVVSKVKNNVEFELQFPALFNNPTNNFDGKYDWRNLSIFTPLTNTSNIIAKGTPEEATEKFNKFLSDINSIPTDLLVTSVRFPLQDLKEDLKQMNDFVQNLDKKKTPKP
jgi:hypothetical protein